MNKIVNYLSIILGDDLNTNEYLGIFKRERLPAGLTLDITLLGTVSPYQRTETRTLNWKNI